MSSYSSFKKSPSRLNKSLNWLKKKANMPRKPKNYAKNLTFKKNKFLLSKIKTKDWKLQAVKKLKIIFKESLKRLFQNYQANLLKKAKSKTNLILLTSTMKNLRLIKETLLKKQSTDWLKILNLLILIKKATFCRWLTIGLLKSYKTLLIRYNR